MGVAGWRFARKRNLGGRADIELEEWLMFCSGMVAAAAGSMIMLVIMR